MIQYRFKILDYQQRTLDKNRSESDIKGGRLGAHRGNPFETTSPTTVSHLTS